MQVYINLHCQAQTWLLIYDSAALQHRYTQYYVCVPPPKRTNKLLQQTGTEDQTMEAKCEMSHPVMSPFCHGRQK